MPYIGILRPSNSLSAIESSDFSLTVMSQVNTMEVWTPPTFSASKVSQVVLGTSGGRKIKGDFPLDRVVINRNYSHHERAPSLPNF